MNNTIEQENKLNDITKKWLKDHPYYIDDNLPTGWEIRFGMRGMFLKYDSVEHVEQKNPFLIIPPFGYCNSAWEELKSNLQPNDEIWRHGGDCGEAILLIRNGKIIEDTYGKYKYPKKGYHVNLTCY